MDPYGLLLPGTRERLSQEAAIERREKAGALLKALNALDDQIIGVVRVHENASEVIQTDKGPAYVKPGYWHVQRKREGMPDSFRPITTATGGFREPDFGVYYELQRQDTWSARNSVDELMARSEAERKAEANRVPDFREEMASDIRAAKRVAGENLGKRRWGKG